jgi:hypothetical protein
MPLRLAMARLINALAALSAAGHGYIMEQGGARQQLPCATEDVKEFYFGEHTSGATSAKLQEPEKLRMPETLVVSALGQPITCSASVTAQST